MCTGKTFSEVFAKFIVPGILGKYDFEFLDKEQMKEKPMINIDATRDPVIMGKWKKSHIFWQFIPIWSTNLIYINL